jgi:hypothetical protein
VSLLEELQHAAAVNEIVRLERRGVRVRERVTLGSLLRVSEALVLLALFDDRIRYDGYEVLRTADITSWRPADRREFYRTAFELKGLQLSPDPGVDLTDMPALLASAQERFPLITIFREHLHPGECDIGRLKLTGDEAFAIHYIDPSAQWRDDPAHYRYADVTRVAFGGEYERTLAMVAESRGPA